MREMKRLRAIFWCSTVWLVCDNMCIWSVTSQWSELAAGLIGVRWCLFWSCLLAYASSSSSSSSSSPSPFHITTLLLTSRPFCSHRDTFYAHHDTFHSHHDTFYSHHGAHHDTFHSHHDTFYSHLSTLHSLARRSHEKVHDEVKVLEKIFVIVSGVTFLFSFLLVCFDRSLFFLFLDSLII